MRASAVSMSEIGAAFFTSTPKPSREKLSFASTKSAKSSGREQSFAARDVSMSRSVESSTTSQFSRLESSFAMSVMRTVLPEPLTPVSM